MRQILSIFVALTAGVILTGCPTLWRTAENGQTETASQIFEKAEAAFKDKQYDKAVELYERIRANHGDFEKAPEVYLRLAEAAYEKGAYEKAISGYAQFVESFPSHKDIPKAKFFVAMSNFKQIRGADLDNAMVRAAADAFKALRDDPEAGEWVEKAGEKYNECLKKLAEKELYKARTYLSMGKYQAARMAAKRVLEEYGKLGFDKDAEGLIQDTKGK